MWSRRLRETFAVTTTGDGAVELLAPREHSLLWEADLKVARKFAQFLAGNPNYTRLLGLAQIGFGVWLTLRHYREE